MHDSFYSGRAFVTLKDKVLQPSSALRHAAEQCRILSSNFPDSPVVVIVSDGGPDHRLTFYSVQVSLLCVFLQLNLDMLVAVRTCPYQSWQNIAERVMSTLNLGLQNVALCRKAMPEEFEKMKLTLTDLRREVTRNPSLQLQLMDSMAQPIVQLSQRFVAMKIKEDHVTMSEPAKVEEITAVFDKIHDIDSSVVATKLRKEDLKDKKPLLDFMKTHCIQSPYVTVYMKRDHFTRLINLQNGSSNPEKKKKNFFEFFFFFTCTRSWAFQLAPRQISPEVSLVWLS